MKIYRVTIVASDDEGDINTAKTGTWLDSQPIEDLDEAVRFLQEYLSRRRDALRTALASQQPLEPS